MSKPSNIVDDAITVLMLGAKFHVPARLEWESARAVGVALETLKNALVPSAATKAAYAGEFTFASRSGRVTYTVPWDTIKEIMAAIRKHAANEAEGLIAGGEQVRSEAEPAPSPAQTKGEG